MNENKITFHAFTAKASGIARSVTTPVKVCQAHDPATGTFVSNTYHDTTALWDTGATNSVITTDTAKALNLKPVGVTGVKHAGGTSQHNTYLVNFVLPNTVQVVGVLATECPSVVGSFGAIIGMDIIARGDFSITNHVGQTWASFRIPSIAPIDYVVEARRLKFAGVGRNDPCPCGSKNATTGKALKFKHCCGK